MFNFYESLFNFSEPYKVKDLEKAYNLIYEMPGFEKKEIQIEVEDDILEINARSEKFGRSIWKRFKLPTDADIKSIDVELLNGILTVQIPKKINKNKMSFEIK